MKVNIFEIWRNVDFLSMNEEGNSCMIVVMNGNSKINQGNQYFVKY